MHRLVLALAGVEGVLRVPMNTALLWCCTTFHLRALPEGGGGEGGWARYSRVCTTLCVYWLSLLAELHQQSYYCTGVAAGVTAWGCGAGSRNAPLDPLDWVTLGAALPAQLSPAQLTALGG